MNGLPVATDDISTLIFTREMSFGWAESLPLRKFSAIFNPKDLSGGKLPADFNPRRFSARKVFHKSKIAQLRN